MKHISDCLSMLFQSAWIYVPKYLQKPKKKKKKDNISEMVFVNSEQESSESSIKSKQISVLTSVIRITLHESHSTHAN